MASSSELTHECPCGQVVFDLAKKQSGAVLTCPWCKGKFTVRDGGRLAKDDGELLTRNTGILKKKKKKTKLKAPDHDAPKPETSKKTKPEEEPSPFDIENAATIQSIDPDTMKKLRDKADGKSSSSSKRIVKRKTIRIKKVKTAKPDDDEIDYDGTRLVTGADVSTIPLLDDDVRNKILKQVAENSKPDTTDALEEIEQGETMDMPSAEELKASVAAAKEKAKKNGSKDEDDDLEEIPALEDDLTAGVLDSDDDVPAWALDGDEVDSAAGGLSGRKKKIDEDPNAAGILTALPKNKHSSRRLGTARSKPVNGRDKDRRSEALRPEDELMPLPKPFELNLEKAVFYMFLGALPLGVVVFAVYMWYGITHGRYELRTYEFFGVTIRGDNPWVWLLGVAGGGLSFFLAWVAYTYLFVFKKKKGGEGESRRKKRKVEGKT